MRWHNREKRMRMRSDIWYQWIFNLTWIMKLILIFSTTKKLMWWHECLNKTFFFFSRLSQFAYFDYLKIIYCVYFVLKEILLLRHFQSSFKFKIVFWLKKRRKVYWISQFFFDFSYFIYIFFKDFSFCFCFEKFHFLYYLFYLLLVLSSLTSKTDENIMILSNTTTNNNFYKSKKKLF